MTQSVYDSLNIQGNLSASGAVSLAGTVSLGPVSQSGLWTPQSNGLRGANGDLMAALGGGAAVSKAGVTLMKITLPQADTVSSLWLGLSATGSGTSTGSYVGLYSSGGTLLTGSADQVSNFTAAAPVPLQCTLGTAQSLSAGFVWAAVLSGLSVTQPSFYRFGSTGGAVIGNLNLSASAYRFAANGTGMSVLPGTINPASNTTANAFAFWVGYS